MNKFVKFGVTTLATVTLMTTGVAGLATNMPTVQAASKATFKGDTVKLNDVTVDITGTEFFKGLEKGDANLVVFKYKITNNSDKDISAMNWYDIFKAYQKDDGELERLEPGAVPLNYANQTNNTDKIAKGSSANGVVAYRLDNKKPVVLKAYQGSKHTKVGQKSYQVTNLKKQDHKDLNIN